MGRSRERLEKRAPWSQRKHWAFEEKDCKEREETVPRRSTKESLESSQLSLGLGLHSALSPHAGQLQCAYKGECGLFCPELSVNSWLFSLGMEKEIGFLEM